MRKAMIILLAVLLPCILGFGAAIGIVDNRKDQVTWQEHTIYGDKSVAEGLRVYTRNNMDASLLWDTVGTLGELLEPETEFSFSNRNHNYDWEITYRGISMFPSYDIFSMQNSNKSNEYLEELFAEVAEAYDNAVKATPDGQEKTFLLDMNEYFDYYPLDGWFDLPGQNAISWIDANDTYTHLMEAARRFNEYFKIPIIGEYSFEFTVDKNYDNVSSSSSVNLTYNPDFYGVVTDDTCYFTFNAVASEGQIADCGQIPGGYGIYSFSFSMNGENQAVPDLDSLATVYSLDPTESFCDLLLSEDQEQLLLLTMKDMQFILTVIDIDTMTCLQRLKVMEVDDDYGCQIHIEDDFIAALMYNYPQNVDGSVSVFARQENGTYAFSFQSAIDNEIFNATEKIIMSYYSDYVMDFNGEYLVLAKNVPAWDREGNRMGDSCDFYVVIYAPGGMAYAGEYTVSLSDVYGCDWDQPCSPFGNTPITVSWD